MSEIKRISLNFHSRVSTFEPIALAGILAAFEANPHCAPTHWGGDERVRKPYNRSDAIRFANKLEPPVGGTIHLYRDRAVQYGGSFGVSKHPFISFDFDKSMVAARWPELLDLADSLASIFQPRFGTVHIRRSVGPWKSEQDRLQALMHYCASTAPVDFNRHGPRGLGMRTYFGGDIVGLFGRDLLLSTPAIVTDLDWGGVRIDLGEDMWNINGENLLERWQSAMRHLEKAKAFAVPEFNQRHAAISFSPSPAWKERKGLKA
jgi:hypothetical protein